MLVSLFELLGLARRQPLLQTFDLLRTSQRSRSRRVLTQRGECFTRRSQMDVIKITTINIINDQLPGGLIQQVGAGRLFRIYRTHRPAFANKLMSQISFTFRSRK